MNSEVFLSYLNQVLGVEKVLVTEEPHPTASFKEPCPFHLLVDAQKYGKEERDLLEKILEALKWPSDRFEIHEISADSLMNFRASHRIQSTEPLHLFLFGTVSLREEIKKNFSSSGTVFEFPGLREMIQNPALKKEVWNKLKPLVQA